MIEKIKQAEAAIRDGDTRTGFEILRQVLADNPDSERAWWIMSGLVPKEQRANCLIQVLRINPQNQLAKETLDKLVDEFTGETASHDKRLVGKYLTWPYVQRSKIYLTLLGEGELISATTEPKLITRVRSAIKEGKFSPTLFRDKKHIPLNQITRIRQILSSLRVYYDINNREDSVRLELDDNSTAEEVLIEIMKKLGDGYSQTEKPIGIPSTLGIAAILILGAGGLTAFLYWGALEVTSGRAAATGSIQTRAIINLLETLGTTGAAVIGAVLLLIALGVSAGLLMKPPMVREIVRLRLKESVRI